MPVWIRNEYSSFIVLTVVESVYTRFSTAISYHVQIKTKVKDQGHIYLNHFHIHEKTNSSFVFRWRNLYLAQLLFMVCQNTTKV